MTQKYLQFPRARNANKGTYGGVDIGGPSLIAIKACFVGWKSQKLSQGLEILFFLLFLSAVGAG